MENKFNYRKICNGLLAGLPQRTEEILRGRFALEGGERKTLEAIGEKYGLTRERVRQIVEEGISKIQEKKGKYQDVFKYLGQTIKSFGDLKKEDQLLNFLGGDKLRNHVFFLLNVDKEFSRFAEEEDFHSFWTKNKETVPLAKKVIESVLSRFEKEKKPFTAENLYEAEKADLNKIAGRKINKEIFNSYLEISQKIQKNPENKFGLAGWLEINPRGIKDKAYLVLKREGKPLHFAQVATSIEKLPFSYSRKVHLATVHNELIKDERFVLVGRGTYALREWGYEPGVVKEVIARILKNSPAPLTKEEVIKKVSEQRFVKENTVSLNLQDRSVFLRDENGKYTVREA